MAVGNKLKQGRKVKQGVSTHIVNCILHIGLNTLLTMLTMQRPPAHTLACATSHCLRGPIRLQTALPPRARLA